MSQNHQRIARAGRGGRRSRSEPSSTGDFDFSGHSRCMKQAHNLILGCSTHPPAIFDLCHSKTQSHVGIITRTTCAIDIKTIQFTDESKSFGLAHTKRDRTNSVKNAVHQSLKAIILIIQSSGSFGGFVGTAIAKNILEFANRVQLPGFATNLPAIASRDESVAHNSPDQAKRELREIDRFPGQAVGECGSSAALSAGSCNFNNGPLAQMRERSATKSGRNPEDGGAVTGWNPAWSTILPTAPMQYRSNPEQAISCADREGNGKCGAICETPRRPAKRLEVPAGRSRRRHQLPKTQGLDSNGDSRRCREGYAQRIAPSFTKVSFAGGSRDVRPQPLVKTGFGAADERRQVSSPLNLASKGSRDDSPVHYPYATRHRRWPTLFAVNVSRLAQWAERLVPSPHQWVSRECPLRSPVTLRGTQSGVSPVTAILMSPRPVGGRESPGARQLPSSRCRENGQRQMPGGASAGSLPRWPFNIWRQFDPW